MSVITTNLYKLYRKYYSTDSGETWTPLNEYGYFLKEESAAQCMPIEPQYRWVADGDNYICSGSSGYDKYQQEKEQVSLDSGVTWADVSPKETRIGSLIEVNSEDCGYEPDPKPPLDTNKAIIKKTDGTWVGIPRNGSSSLTSGETSQYRSTAVDVEIGSGITTLGTAVFSGFSKLDSIIFGDDVRSVGTSAFTWDSGLTTVVFNNGITSLSDVAFGGCSGIQHITLPSTITSMGNSCFDTCTKLEEVVIPSGLTAINVYCFHYCPSLTSATIPSGVSTIGDNAFSGCTGLAEITCNRNTAPTISANTFKNLPSTGTLYVPSGSNYSTWIAKLPNWTIQYI